MRKLQKFFGIGMVTLTATWGSTVIFANPAKAQLEVCNKFSQTAYLAVGYGTAQDQWYSEGWFSIKPGQCETVIDEPLVPGGAYYFYGADRGDSWTWEGDTNQNFCVHPENKFTLTKTGDDCGAGGTEMRPFFEVTVDSSDFTLDLTN